MENNEKERDQSEEKTTENSNIKSEGTPSSEIEEIQSNVDSEKETDDKGNTAEQSADTNKTPSASDNQASEEKLNEQIPEPKAPETPSVENREIPKEQEPAESVAEKIEPEITEESDSEEEPADEDEQHSESEEEQHLDYSDYTVKQMVQVLESLLKEDNFEQTGRILKEIKKSYDEVFNKTRQEAFDKYVAEGGEKDGFEYREDEYDQRFQRAYNKLKEKRSQFYNSLEKQKEQNLLAKQEILDKIRELVDSEETNVSITALKELQESWKKIGVIPGSQAKSLWANYNALLDRFYDQRSIYFELKELDRKKNLDLKIELCEKAELLSEEQDVRKAIKELNELHEEFKHIGPVPKEEQEALWERFKHASDKIYVRRKDYYEKLKGELKVNESAKEVLAEKVKTFADFESEKISDWNAKTKEIIRLQKEWEQIGSLPKERAKEINKLFWSSFKSFFNKKSAFFKKIDAQRKGNLDLKQELVEQAEALKDSEDFRKTSEKLKLLQKNWKEIGPVPEKYRNEVYFKFKKACDHFFSRRRSNSGHLEKEYEDNLQKKMTLCDELDKMISTKSPDLKRIKEIEKEWNEIGFVPKANIRSIQKRYTEAIGKITDKADISETEKHKIRFSAQFNTENYGPGTEKLIQKKEGALRRQISTLENEINLWKNNIDFFAASKNADKLKQDFKKKIESAQSQLKSLKEQLKVISNI